MEVQEVPRKLRARSPKPRAVLGVLVETEQWVETAEPAAMRTP
jgi:hypothetical protein